MIDLGRGDRAAGTRVVRSGDARGRRADRHAAARMHDAGRRRHRSVAGVRRRARCRSASCTPSRSRRWSSSAGRRCARSGRARGSSSRRRSPSCSTSSRIPASRPTSRRRRRPSLATLDARANRYSPPRPAGDAAIDAAKRPSACARSATARVRDSQSAIRNGGVLIRRIGASWRRASRRSRRASCQARRSSTALEGIVARRSAQRTGAPASRLSRLAGRRLRARGAGVPRRGDAAACRRRTSISVWRRAWGGAAIWPAPSGAGRGPAARAGQSGRHRESRHPPGGERRLAAAIQSLSAALAADPGLHEARFNLALAYAKAGRRAEAAATARELLARLPPNAPQRTEVERLLRAVQ